MHHVVLERWSRGDSVVHRRDARVKLIALIVFLAAVATTPPGSWLRFAGYAAFVGAGIFAARLSLWRVAERAAIVLPFSGVLAVFAWISGNGALAAAVALKSYISANAVLLIVAATPLPDLLRALEWMRAPGMLVLVTQFLYRYLFVLSEQAQHMRAAARSRGGSGHGFRGAAGALSVLFAKSYGRADGIYRAMLARGFDGRFPAAATRAMGAADLAFLLTAAAGSLAARLLVP